MPLDEQHSWALLRELDAPDGLDFPRSYVTYDTYNHAATRARFDQLAARLDQRFRCTCTVDRGVQDANHHGTIVIPATATASGEHLTITVSNYGNLVAVTLGSPAGTTRRKRRSSSKPPTVTASTTNSKHSATSPSPSTCCGRDTTASAASVPPSNRGRGGTASSTTSEPAPRGPARQTFGRLQLRDVAATHPTPSPARRPWSSSARSLQLIGATAKPDDGDDPPLYAAPIRCRFRQLLTSCPWTPRRIRSAGCPGLFA
ncbi:hypothetical protein FHR34_004777 [Kitasatospora kifunensis]|uniref:Uncharacterized protein n=1 Tax=Kitasatospora kifunensis TaxID=58351 RepID=A0A7W7VXK2_KITKI|nr:hypothetical protein [Kitasatospora kifunensis]